MKLYHFACLSSLSLLIACASEKDQSNQEVAIEENSEPTMSEVAEANPSYWGYIDYLWASNGENFTQEKFSAYVQDWRVEADATDVAYTSFGYVPVEPDERFDGVWAVSWKSKALRDQAWEKWLSKGSTEKLAEKHEDFITLGGENYEDVFGFYAFRPREMSNPWVSQTGPDQAPYNVDIRFCNFNENMGFDDLREVINSDFYPWLDNYELSNPDDSYNFSIEVPTREDATFDYLWKNIHKTAEQADQGNNAWIESGLDIQGKFDSVSTCEPSNGFSRFAGYMIKEEA